MFDKLQYKLWKHLNKKMMSNGRYLQNNILGKISDITSSIESMKREIEENKKNDAKSINALQSSFSDLIQMQDGLNKQINDIETRMDKKRINIFLTGLGWSGNTAVKDFFISFKEVAVVYNEFDIFRATPWHIGPVPGPMDIVHKFSKNEDIFEDVNLFRAFYYLLGVHWYSDFDKKYFEILDELSNTFLKFSNSFKKVVELSPHRIAELPIWKKRLTTIASSSMNDLLCSYKPEKKIGFFRHGLRSWEPIDTQLPFLPSTCKIIITRRDPRDSWTDMVRNKDWFEKHGTSIERFIDGRKNEYRMVQSSSNRVMYVNFEDLCLHYSETRKKLMDFVGLDENSPLNDAAFFDPNKSVKNIGIYKTFENQDDIRKIEEEMSEYLYRNEN